MQSFKNPHDFIEESNDSNNPEFEAIAKHHISRRGVLKGGAGLTCAAFLVHCL